MKNLVLFAHAAENPWGDKIPDGFEVAIIGVGESCIPTLRAIRNRISEDKQEVRILVAGTCCSFKHKIGESLYSMVVNRQGNEIEYLDKYQGTSLCLTVDKFISPSTINTLSESTRTEFDLFDMEWNLIKGILLYDNPDSYLIQQLILIKVVSDTGAIDLDEWEHRARQFHPIIKDNVEFFLHHSGNSSASDLVKIYQNYPLYGARFLDIFPALTSKELSSFYDWFLYHRFSYECLVAPDSCAVLLSGVLCPMNFIPVRKRGKLPKEDITFKAIKKYGSDILCVNSDHFYNVTSYNSEIRVVILDDVLATGGTVSAIYENLNGLKVMTSQGQKVIRVVASVFFTEISGFYGRKLLETIGLPVYIYKKF